MSQEDKTPSSDEESFEDCQEAFDADIQEITTSVESIEIAKDFSLEKLNFHFSKCFEFSPDLSIAEYILGYQEVYKFLTLLGSVFTWVAADVQAKIDILQKYNTGDDKENYQTIKKMIHYEVELNLVKTKKRDDPSGSRTLLRLHRALEYVVAFLAKLDDIELTDKCAPISREAYEATLMKYHIWAVQKAAKFAMGLLPTKAGLVQKVNPEAEKDSQVLRKVETEFMNAVNSMKKVYSASQVFYEEKDLLNIP